MRLPLFFAIALFTITMPAFAQDAPVPADAPVDKSRVYAPDHCEFTVTFPDAPYKESRCAPLEPDAPADIKPSCTEQMTYTQVYTMSSSVNVRVTCSEIDPSTKERYSASVMEGTLRAMADLSGVTNFETNSASNDQYKQATLTGETVKGVTPSIFIAQLWIGKKSAFSVEAELTGEADKDADTLFRDILQSIQFRD